MVNKCKSVLGTFVRYELLVIMYVLNMRAEANVQSIISEYTMVFWGIPSSKLPSYVNCPNA